MYRATHIAYLVALIFYVCTWQLRAGEQPAHAVGDSPKSAAGELPPLAELLAKRRAVTQQFVEAAKKACEANECTPYWLILAVREQLDAELDVAVTPQLRVTAYKAAAKEMGDLAERLKLRGNAEPSDQDNSYDALADVARWRIKLVLARELPEATDSDHPFEDGVAKSCSEAAEQLLRVAQAAFKKDAETLPWLLIADREHLGAALDESYWWRLPIRPLELATTRARFVEAALPEGTESQAVARLALLRCEIDLAIASLEVDDNLKRLKELRTEWHAATQGWIDSIKLGHHLDTTEIAIQLQRDLLKLQLAIVQTPTEAVRACTTCVDAAIETERKVKTLHDALARGGEMEKLYFAQSARLKAQIGLSRARAIADDYARYQLGLSADAVSGVVKFAANDVSLDRLVALRRTVTDDLYEAAKTAPPRRFDSIDYIFLAIDEQLGADLDAAKSADDRIAARARALTTIREWEKKISTLYEAGKRGGEAEKYWRARSVRLAAEINLTREQATANGKEADVGKAISERVVAAKMFYQAAQAARDTDTVTLDLFICAYEDMCSADLAAAKTREDRIKILDVAYESATNLERKEKAAPNFRVVSESTEWMPDIALARAFVARVQSQRAREALTDPKDRDELNEIFLERVGDLKVFVKEARGSYYQDDRSALRLVNAYREQLVATLDTPLTRAEREQAYLQSINGLHELETDIALRRARNDRFCNLEDLHVARSARLKAEIGLLRALQTTPAEK